MALLRTQPRVCSRPGPRVQIPISIRKTDGHYLTESKQGRCVECKNNEACSVVNVHETCIFIASPSSTDLYNVSVCVTNSYVQVAYFSQCKYILFYIFQFHFSVNSILTFAKVSSNFSCKSTF
jgi:hypothetical protein